LNVKQNSASFINKLFHDHNSGLVRFLTHKLSDPEEAADVAQTAYQKLMTVENPERLENAKGYLYQTAMNLAIDRIRTAKHRASHLRGLRDNPEQSITTDTPDRKLDHTQRLDQIDRAIRELPENCQRSFLMHRGEDKTYGEIADCLDVSVSMVEKYIIQALKHLRNL